MASTSRPDDGLKEVDTLNQHETPQKDDISKRNLIALVDMGSNGIRFSISDISPPTARVMPTIYQDRLGISLYDVQYKDGEKVPIPKEIIDKVCAALIRFKNICEDFSVPDKNIRIIATEATRAAINSVEYRGTIKSRTGLEVEMLPKEKEGEIGALGVASSFSSLKGVVMDLGGGSIQLSWLDQENGETHGGTIQSVSLPYGAAAVKRQIDEAQASGPSAFQDLRGRIKEDFRQGLASLAIPSHVSNVSEHSSGLKLYLSGGGFRGWGYMVMASHEIDPYPIPTINGFEVSRTQFLRNNQEKLQDSDNVFQVSSRRVSQLPAITFLVKTLMDAIPEVSSVYFAQGGVREGILFSQLPPEVRSEHPLVAATRPFAPASTEALLALLTRGIPSRVTNDNLALGSESFDSQNHIPSFSTSQYFLYALIHLINYHASHPKDIRPAAALRSTTTGLLGGAHGLAHMDRALLALALCERWGGEISPSDEEFHQSLQRLVGPQRAWWAKYCGILAQGIGDAYPAGVVRTERLRLSSIMGHDGDDVFVQVKTQMIGLDELGAGWVKDLQKVGKKKKGAVEGYRVKVRVVVDDPVV
ncbi:hypothetical protein MMC11_002459 [Xylographa trunciseda]|nr:hypothetical protein [Xylographa trunciseda]